MSVTSPRNPAMAARGTTASTRSSAPAFLAAQNALSPASVRRPARGGRRGAPGAPARGPPRPVRRRGGVFPGAALAGLPAGPEPLARGQHRLDADPVMAGDAVLPGPHPPRFRGDGPAEAGAHLP